MKSNAVVFLGMAYPYGIIRHMALLGAELYKCHGGYDYYFASIEREPHPGSWQIIIDTVPNANVIKTVRFEDLVLKIVGLTKVYEKVIVHTGGGWGQTKHFVRARRHLDRVHANRLALIATTHSYRNDTWLRVPMSLFQYALYRLFYKKVVFQCQDAADKFVGGKNLIKCGKGVIIPLGCEDFVSVENGVPAGLSGNPDLVARLMDKTLFKFVYLAGFRPGKMHAWLVKAIAPVLREHPEAQMIFCGDGNSEVIKNVHELISEFGMERQFCLPGKVQRRDIPWVLKHCDCAVVPSRAETFGHSFIEPMFAGLPVLGTRVGIGREVIKDGVTGFCFSLDNPEKLLRSVETVLGTPGMSKEMGNNARHCVQAFSHEAVAREHSRLYEQTFGEI